MAQDTELTAVEMSETLSADCVADWQRAERFETARRAAISDDYDWSGFSL